jgi:CHAT domain-containing protein
MKKLIGVLAAFLFAVLPAIAQEAEAIKLGEEFFQTFPDKNFEKMQTLWSAKSPERERFLKQFRFSLTDTENISLRDFAVKGATLEGDKLILQISLTMDATDAKQKRPKWNFGKWNRVLRFVKENDLWKVWECKFAEEEFAEKLVNAKDETEQDALLTENPHLLNRFLRRAIVDLSRNLRARNELGKTVFLAEMMERLAVKTGDEIWLSRALFLRGALADHLGEQAKSGEFYLKGETLSLKLNDEEGLVLIWFNLGSLRLIQVETEQGKNYHRKAGELAEKVGDVQSLLRLRNNQGARFFAEAEKDVWTSSHNFDRVKLDEKPLREAVIYFRQLRDIYAALGEERDKAIAIANLGEAFRWLREYDAALQTYNESLALAEKHRMNGLRDGLLVAICQVYIGQNRLAEAAELIEKIITKAIPNNYSSEFFLDELIAGNIFQRLGQTEKTEKYFLGVIEKYERQRKSLSTTLTRQRFMQARTFPYYEMTNIRAEQNRVEEALQFSEMTKARILFDVIRSGTKYSEKSLTEAEKAETERLKTAIENLNRQILDERLKVKADAEKIKKLNENLSQARIDLEKYQAYLFSIHPEMSLQRGEIPLLNLKEIETLLPDERTAIVEFTVTDEKVLAFVITKNEKLEVFQLPIPRRELVPKVRGFWQRIAEKNLDYKAPAKELFQMLLKPLENRLKERENLIIVPDGVLWELPFQALISDENKILIENFAVSYAPSLSVLREMSKVKTGNQADNFLGFGNPSLPRQIYASGANPNRNFKFEPLPDAEREIAKIATFYGKNQSRLFVGNNAGEDIFKTQATNFSVLHLATHGVADNENPMFSFLVFAQGKNSKDDGILEAWEVMQLNLNADIAVLSACETGRGRIGDGEGIIGLSWAFFVAGVPTTVVSGWNVESSRTAGLMVEFYRRLKQKSSEPKALQAAMISILKNKKTNHPFYWAGFVLIGKN